jgi:predicted NAD-dependent protein-ADP-ribosyltransferase YbiA (DUF1768 family)
MKRKLISTFGAVLVEGNWWHDTFWGVCKGKMEGRTCKHIGDHLHADADGEIDPTDITPMGSNKLGLLLMELRQEVSGVVPSTSAAV